jgi:DNA (cytosine-5)-methyltransferase 1
MNLRQPQYGYHNIDINEFLVNRSEELRGYIEDARRNGDLVGFIGGPPCPDFSIAGKNKGKHGDNGKLSLSYIKLIISMQPDFFLFENVKGLWKTARHREFYEELKCMLHNAGYCTTDRLTNSIEFGAPQDRDRILMLGIKDSLIKPNQKENSRIIGFDWEAHIRYELDVLRNPNWPQTEAFIPDSIKNCPDGVIKELTVEYWFEKNDVYNHPNANDSFTPRAGITRMETIDEGDVCKKSYKRLHRWRYSPTVAYGNNEVHLHPYKVRRLSVSEALSLQSLPKEFVLPPDMTLSDKFKTVGNGVPYMLSSAIALTIKEYLEEML